jgi:hypothetical protein
MSDLTILAVDPGNIESAYVVWDGKNILGKGKIKNEQMREYLTEHKDRQGCVLALEWIKSYGMKVGDTIFETCLWCGRYVEVWGGVYELVFRRDVKMALCCTMHANDANIRQYLINRFGEPGIKKKPNPITYGLKADVWQAFAIAVYYYDKQTGYTFVK